MYNSMFLCAALTALVSGCHSLHVEADLTEAADLLHQHAGVEVDGWPIPAAIASGTRLSLDESVERALLGHPALRREIARVAEARIDVADAGLLPNPMLELAIGRPLDGKAATPGVAAVMQIVSALWRRPARISLAETALRARVLSLVDFALSRIARTKTAFSELHHASERVGIAERLVQVRDHQLELIAAMLDAGEANLREQSRARIARSKAIDERFLAIEARDVAKRQFLELIGEAVADIDVDIDGELPTIVAAPDERATVRLAIDRRLDVQAAFSALGTARATERLAKLDAWPDLELGATFQRSIEDRESLSFKLGIEVPLFDTGRVSLAKAQAIEARTEHDAEAILSLACLEARVARVHLVAANQRLGNVTKESVPAAGVDLHAARAAVDAGESSRLVALEAEAQQLEIARLANALSAAAYRALFEFERAIGGEVYP